MYEKYHDPWTSTHRLSAKALNHIETQWDQTKADADAHDHDTRYYPRSTADVTFFSLSYRSGFDADLLDGKHYSDILAVVLPTGTIMAWYGTDSTIPSGWHICDGGTYGGKASPDLRDRFIIGAGGSYAVGATAGPATWDGTVSPTGTVTVTVHTLTTDELPAHTHTYEDHIRYGSSYTTNDYSFPGHVHALSSYSDGSTTIGEQATGGGSHGHSGSMITFNGVDPRPLYHSLYYIMKYA